MSDIIYSNNDGFDNYCMCTNNVNTSYLEKKKHWRAIDGIVRSMLKLNKTEPYIDSIESIDENFIT